jgi:carbonic anhydrase/acetyltransferase-like protein (isoleucine patch superfamily)
MYRYIIEDLRHIPPFNEEASELTVGAVALKIHQENVFTALFGDESKLGNIFKDADGRQTHHAMQTIDKGPAVLYRDNLWFDREFMQYFIDESKKTGKACRAAFSADDPAFRTYALPLTKGFERSQDGKGKPIFLIDLWYFPNGYTHEVVPIVVPSEAEEMGFYSVPDFMKMEQGELTHYAPLRAVLSIESWVHVYFANIIFGNFARASRYTRYVKNHNFYALKVLWKAIMEQKQILSTSEVVKVGKNTNIHPTAIITGPAEIGDNCTIGPGAVIDNCTIGDNVTIDDGCVMFMSTIANNCFLPFRAALYLTSVMESTIIAQNTCLQMCVIGRNSFVGAGSTFTDFNLVAQKPIRASNMHGEMESVGQIVLGSAIGHNCRIGSGMVMFPGRMIESDVVLVASPQRRVIARSVTYEESDHHFIAGGETHRRFYPRADEIPEPQQTWDNW